jgi:hypothetical protein
VSRQKGGLEALAGTSALMVRLNAVRKRKRAYGGKVVDMAAKQRRIAPERKRKLGR